MKRPNIDPISLRQDVANDMALYLAEYTLPPSGSTLGAPWAREKTVAELAVMKNLLIEPYLIDYFCDDVLLPEDERLPKGIRTAYVVAEDNGYRLLFDYEANDYVLVSGSTENGWGSWGIRGDATSTFLAR